MLSVHAIFCHEDWVAVSRSSRLRARSAARCGLRQATTGGQKINDTRLGAAGYPLTPSPDAAGPPMAAKNPWRRTAAAKARHGGVPLASAAADRGEARPPVPAG